MATAFTLPELGENVAGGDVLHVLVKVGDEVKRDQPVLELETEKATIEVPVSVAGRIAEITVSEGQKIAVGQTVLLLDGVAEADAPASGLEAAETAIEDAGRESAPTGDDQEEAAVPVEAVPSTAPAPTIPAGPTDMLLPELGENVEGGEVVHVLVSAGEPVKRDQPVLELETDKATIEVPSSLEGRVLAVYVKDGQKVKVGEPVLQVEALGGQPAASAAIRWQQVRAVPAADAQDAEDYRSVTHADPHAMVGGLDLATQGRIRRSAIDKPGMLEEALAEVDAESTLRRGGAKVVSFEQGKAAGAPEAPARLPAPAAPSVRRVARELGVDISKVEGSGPGGRISAEDVKAYVKRTLSSGGPRDLAPAGVPARTFELPDFTKWGPVERKPMGNVRRKTAERLGLAWAEIPHVTQFDKADVTALEELRTRFGKRVEAGGGKLTVTAVMLKVAAAALKAFPQFNASVDMASREIVYKQYIHIGVAVDTDRGLLVPVVRDVDKKGITELAAELAQASERARARKTGLEEMQGGTFTISNLGGVGGTCFTPIVNHPEVAILGMSRSRVEPVFIDGEFKPRQMLPLSLSYDHRVIDGADGIRFLRWVCDAIEQPFLLAL